MRVSHFIISILLLPLGAVQVAAFDVASDAATVAEHGRALQNGVRDEEVPSWLRGKGIAETSHEAVEEVYARSRGIVEHALNRAGSLDPVGPGRRIEVFVSLSIGDAALREVLEEASGRADVVVVFRGIPETLSFADGIRAIQRLARDFDPLPTIAIDPTRFRALGVTEVPAIALHVDGKRIATARGITGIDAFLARVTSGKRGDMGRLGPVRPIAESDLISVLEQRLSMRDFAPAKASAMKRYFERADFLPLPAAREPRRRSVDPTVIVTRDITDADGRVLVEAGRRINPLDLFPFSSRLIVFDATDRAQLEVARRAMREVESKTILLTTRLDRDAGWAGLKRLEDEMRAPVYLLTSEVRERFHIERTVSVVVAKGRAFEIRELPAIQAEEGK